MNKLRQHLLAGPLLCLGWACIAAEPPDTNYDENKVPAYVLPDPLVGQDGAKVSNARTWQKKRRPEVVRMFEEHVYGRSPKPPRGISFEVTSLEARALGGLATRKEVTVFLTGAKDGPKLDLLLYLPNAATKPVPAFLGLNFYGNHCVHPDPGIKLSQRWRRATKEMGIVNNRATEASRGGHASRWQVERILERGYALATVYYGDLEPDFTDGWKQGLRAALSPQGASTVWQPDGWGAIGAWAWGLSRALDYLEREPAVDARRVAVIGHSRLGKTALWAGAQDERFALVISNNSGEGGASLVRRRFGENLAHSVSIVPYWYCGRYREYADRESALPVDAHMLIALIAPRPVYVASATKDLWADPRGEFLAAKHAEPVYRLFRRAGLGVDDQPPPDRPVGDVIGYHLRTGEHDVTAYDWQQYLNFADRHFKHGSAAKKPASAKSPKSLGRARPIKLLTRQRADGEFPGWKSLHETPGTRTADVWRLQPDGVLVCKGTPRGYLYTERDYTDFTIEFDWRWPAGATNSNGGMLVRMTGAHGIWPRCLEFQINMGQAGDFWGIRGYEFSGPADRLKTIAHDTLGPLRHLKRLADAERPVGEWNHYEADMDGGTVTLKINGVLVNQATGCEAVPGKILLTAEGQEIHFRNVRLAVTR